MNINQIQHFLQLSKSEHMPSAAEFLNMSQPALSRSIAALEEELGVKLFDRVGRRVKLNENGRIYAEYAERVVALVGQASLAMHAFRYEVTGSVEIRCFSFAPIIMDCVGAYSELNPYVSFNVSQSDQNAKDMPDFYLSATSGGIDYPQEDEAGDWIGLPLLEEEFVLIVNRSMRKPDWPESKQEIDLTLLKDEFFVSMPMNNEFFRDIVFDFAEAYGFVPKIRVLSNDFLVKVNSVESGMCAAFIPESCLADALAMGPHIDYYYLRPGLTGRKVYLLHQKERLMTETARDFLRFAEDYYR